MKKKVLKTILPILFSIMIAVGLGIRFPVRTLAAGVSIDPSAGTVMVGETVTVTVTLYGSAIYAYSGYIDCDGIFSGETGGFADGANGGGSVSLTFTYQAVGEGTGSIYVGGCEVSDGESKEDAGGASCTITVLGYDNGGGGTGGNAGGGNYNDNYAYDWGTINDYEVGEGSGNTNLALLEVEGYTLTDEGFGIFSVTVGASVKKIKINALAEDAAAYVEGAGEFTLAEGENYFDVVVYAENGLAQAYTIKVLRRGDKVALSDLIAELKDTTEESVIVALKDGDKLTKEMIDAIAKWGKELHLNRYDADGKLLYGWTLNGKAIAEMQDFKAFDPTVSFQSNAEDEINELSNFASGKHLRFAAVGELPKGTTFTFAAGEDFKKDDTVRLYYFDSKENTLTQVGEEFIVEGNEITIPLSHCSEYFVTRALIKAPALEEKQGLSRKDMILYIALGVLLAIIIVLVILLILKQRKPNASKPAKEAKPAKKKSDGPADDFFDSFDVEEEPFDADAFKVEELKDPEEDFETHVFDEDDMIEIK